MLHLIEHMYISSHYILEALLVDELAHHELFLRHCVRVGGGHLN